MAKTYDLVVIGTGTAASVAAAQCRSAGWRVAVIDHLPFGGTCALRAAIRRRCWWAWPRGLILPGGCTAEASEAASR
jgi:pyruvate/2-oxoglutarate dehydrogenase complex dihydrolipoamide dehydrogenase (E3) component